MEIGRRLLGIDCQRVYDFYTCAQDIYTVYTCVHVYIYIHIHIHTYVSTYIPTYMHAFMHTYVRAYVHTYVHTYINHLYILCRDMSKLNTSWVYELFETTKHCCVTVQAVAKRAVSSSVPTPGLGSFQRWNSQWKKCEHAWNLQFLSNIFFEAATVWTHAGSALDSHHIWGFNDQQPQLSHLERMPPMNAKLLYTYMVGSRDLGVPHPIIHLFYFILGFSIINHPAIGDPPFEETSTYSYPTWSWLHRIGSWEYFEDILILNGKNRKTHGFWKIWW